MKLKFLVLFLLLSTPVFADENSVVNQLIDMELIKDEVKAKGPAVFVAVRQTEEPTQAEFSEATVMDAPKNEKEEIKKIKVEIGADHSPLNYPQFLASVFTLDFSNPRINIGNIKDGGVVVDEIPTLVNPLVISIKEAQNYLHYTDNEYMAVVEINGDARAYPLRVLNWHQGVNDDIGGQPVFVAYDPLSGNIMAMDRRVVGKKETTFGVTGQVYNSASLYYDRATKSIWSAFENMAVTGSLSGTRMKRYKAVLTTWKSFIETYPQGVVLDTMNTGYERNYRQNPYGDYAKNGQMLFQSAYTNETFPRKEYMLGIRLYKGSRRVEAAIPVNTLLDYKSESVDLMFEQLKGVEFQQIPVTFKRSKPYGFFEVSSSDDKVVIETFYSYWFVWSAYNPNSRVVTTLD